MASTARKESEVKEYFDEPDELQKKIKKLAQLVRKSNHFVVYTGAGISTSCGIADYRSGMNTVLQTGAGKWAKEAAIQQGKVSKKEMQQMNKKVSKKRVSTFKAVPSPSHMALVALAEAGYLKHLVSQNTDGLHRRSGFPINQFSELHGNGTLEVCGTCDKVYMRDFKCRNKAVMPRGVLSRLKYVADKISDDVSDAGPYSQFIIDSDKEHIATALSEAYDIVKNRKMDIASEKRLDLQQHWSNILESIGRKTPRYLHFTGRYCTVKGCSGELRDTIINFGESLPEETLEQAQNESSKADLYLVLGSSCTVEPAANMPEEVGLKWRNESESGSDAEPVHNLAICNIQKTPLHYLCSLPLHSKIDDVMIGLMKELQVKIPKWYLERYVKIEVNEMKMLCVSGVDRDGTTFSLFKSVVLRKDGKRIRKIIDNKKHKENEYNFMVSIGNEENDNDEKESIKDAKGLSLELAFCGNYEEPNLIIALDEYLNEFVDDCVEGQIVLKMIMDPNSKIWSVGNKMEQLKDDNVKKLWWMNQKKNDEN